MTQFFGRREFVSSLMAGVSGLSLVSCEDCFKKIAERPIRRSLFTLPEGDPVITAYRAAVAAMKALPASDPRSWAKQAQIHYDFCAHGNWFFLPWHRAYLTYFEQICRKLLGQADFALPYWDWTADAHIHPAFWSDPATNALFHSPRGFTAASTVTPEAVGRPVIDSILDETNFLLFASGEAPAQRPPAVYGRLEGTPHNSVHGQVGGTMQTFHSPLDPVFWTHHNMIECLWVEWNSRGHANSDDSAWLNYVFTDNFVDGDGNPVNPSVALTFLMPVLSYRFDGLCGGADATALSARVRLQSDTAAFRKVLSATAPARLNVLRRFAATAPVALGLRPPGAAQVIPTDAAALDGFISAAGANRLVLNIADMDLPVSTPDVFIRVFVGTTTAGPTTPTTDPHYADSFAFFTDPGHGQMTGGYVVDVSATVRRLAQAGALPSRGRIPIQLVAVPFPGREATGAPLTVRRLELALVR